MFKTLCNLTIDKQVKKWYNISVKGRETKTMGAVKIYIVSLLIIKIFQRNFEKPLDKTAKLWYNIYVIKRANLSLINKKFYEKEGKNRYDTERIS